MAPIVSGYGTWKSPLTAARVTAGTLRFDHLVVDGSDLYWTEGRASEGGRYVVVRRRSDGNIADVTPPEMNVRTRVHEYGGAAYVVHCGDIYFSNFKDQRLYRQRPNEIPQPITAEGFFYADASIDALRSRLLCVREDHRGDEVVNAIVAVAFDGTNEEVLAAGADFYSDPACSPDGSRISWLQWNQPNMPWDGTELWVAEVRQDGSLADAYKIAGGARESIFQPTWSPDGELYFVSDRSGWWNLYKASSPGASGAGGPAIEHLLPMQAEFGKPQWVFSDRTYCFIDRHHIAATFTEGGRWHLGILDLRTREFRRVDVGLEPIDGICTIENTLYFLGGSPTEPMCVAGFAVAMGDDGRAHGDSSARATSTVQRIRSSSGDRIPPEWISVAESVTYDSNGAQVHAFYYAPRNPDYVAPEGEKPPLIVLSHGGPTAATRDVLDARLQFWTSRGFALLDVNYGGSTGFGREYRNRLNGAWGIVDVADCINGARCLVESGKADPERLAIRGGSAGGYTTLAALTFYDLFKAGASYYGVSDVEVLAQDTHKFESRYLDSLIGPYPAARDVYRERSPIHFTDRLSAALIVFQGLEDKVVPPNQAEMIVDAVKRKGLPVAYVPFEGEQHGFRRAENIIRCLEGELYFYGVVFGFAPADPIEPVPIFNAPARRGS